jgi:large-conductance mechanosensitive channel
MVYGLGVLSLQTVQVIIVPSKVKRDVSKNFTSWSDGTTSIKTVGRLTRAVINFIIISCAKLKIYGLRTTVCAPSHTNTAYGEPCK